MSKKIVNSLTVAVGAALLGSVAVANASTAFQLTDLGAGYMVMSAGEGKCGEGKCGMAAMDTDKNGSVSSAEHAAAAAARFAAADTNKDGSVSAAEMDAAKKAHEGKCGEGKCGAEKGKEGSCGAEKGKEGSCGAEKGKEGSCGGSK